MHFLCSGTGILDTDDSGGSGVLVGGGYQKYGYREHIISTPTKGLTRSSNNIIISGGRKSRYVISGGSTTETLTTPRYQLFNFKEVDYILMNQVIDNTQNRGEYYYSLDDSTWTQLLLVEYLPTVDITRKIATTQAYLDLPENTEYIRFRITLRKRTATSPSPEWNSIRFRYRNMKNFNEIDPIFSDIDGLRSALGISSQTNLLPWAVIPVGHPLNYPPDTPRNPYPEDGETDIPFNIELSWTGGDPDPDDIVTYDVYFGTTSPPPKIVSNHPESTYNPGQLANLTTYYWQIIAFDEHGAATVGPIWSFITTFNYPPDEPTITGKAKGRPNAEYEYTFVAKDANMDDLYYFIDWGDGTNSGWIGPYHSDEEIVQSHKWSEKGIYNISCKAKDIYDAESNWEFLQVTMPRDRTNINTLFFRFINQFLFLKKLLF